MKHTIGFLLLAGGALATPAVPAVAQAKPDEQAVARGRVIYERYCASCHGVSARGDGALAPDLQVPPTDLTGLAAKSGGKFPFDAVAKAIDGRKTTRGHGAPDMPVWGEIFPKTAGTGAASVTTAVGRITHYLWSIQKTAP